MTLTLDESGKALTETQDDVTMPVDYTFECINDFVHSPETHFEEIQALALGMASHIAKIEKQKQAFKDSMVYLGAVINLEDPKCELAIAEAMKALNA